MITELKRWKRHDKNSVTMLYFWGYEHGREVWFTEEKYKAKLAQIKQRDANYYLTNRDRILSSQRNKLFTNDRSALNKRWRNMMTRCYNPKCASFKNYGGRADYPILVDLRWHKFENFLLDVQNHFVRGKDIDRKNNDGNYGPNNFRFTTRSQNSQNRRCSKLTDNDIHEIARLKFIEGFSWLRIANVFQVAHDNARRFLKCYCIRNPNYSPPIKTTDAP